MSRSRLLVYGCSDEQLVDKKKALDFYLQSADNGCPNAMYNAGLLLDEGIGGQPENKESAFNLYLRSANEEHGPAMIKLALGYLETAKEDKENLKSALFWLEKADLLKEPLAPQYLEIARKFADPATSFLEPEAPVSAEDGVGLENLVKKSTQIISDSSHAAPSSTEKQEQEAPVVPSEQAVQKDSSDSEDQKDRQNTITNTTVALPKEAKKTTNIKLIRQNLREMGRLEKERSTQSVQQKILKLTDAEQKIADAIFEEDVDAIDHNALITLFCSNFFDGQVEITPTKNGIAVNGFNRLTKHQASTGTHRKHKNSSSKGAEPKFVKKLIPILQLFGVTPSGS